MKNHLQSVGKLIFGLAFLFLPSLVWGAEATIPVATGTPNNQGESSEAIVIATTRIENATIVSQDGSKVKLSFDIRNEKQAQPQLKYVVSLMRKTNSGSAKAYEKVYDEVLSVGENQVVHKEIEYEAPAFLNGEWGIWVSLVNQSSLVLGVAMVDNVKFSGTGEFLEILTDSCYLTIKGNDQVKYNLIQGVDVSQSETLVAHCEVKNNFKSKVSAKPIFETYWRNSRGAKVSSGSGDLLSLEGGEKKQIIYEIQPAKVPQAYDFVLSFQDERGGAISNKVNFHYVVQGVSATIQNLRLDKDYYQKGEVAKVSLFWTPSADIFPGARSANGSPFETANIALTIQDAQGKDCVAQFDGGIKYDLKGNVLELSVLRDCLDPSVKISLKDDKGNVLDQGVFGVKTITENSQDSGVREQKTVTGSKRALIFMLALLPVAIVLVWFLIKKAKGNGRQMTGLILLFLLSVGLLWLGGEAQAQTFIVAGKYEGHSSTFYTSYNVSLNNYNAYPGQAIYMNGSGGQGSYCSNGDQLIRLTAQPDNGGFFYLINYAGEPGFDISPLSGNDHFHANGSGGQHCVTFCGYSGNQGAYSCVNECYNTYINGACGSANGQTFTSAPATNLCAAGNKSALTATATGWTWTCYGANGGGNASCSATVSCAGNRCDGTPVTLLGNQRVCGPRLTLERCTPGGWFNTGIACSCTCSGNRCDGAPVVLTNTQTVCGTDSSVWRCDLGNLGTSWVDTNAPCACGACGSANGGTFNTAPTTNLCSRGTPSAVAGSGPWSWTCTGNNGGTTVSCAANPQPTNGVCGSANGQSFVSDPPVASRCNSGTQVNFWQNATGFYWDCLGGNGGANALMCSSNRTLPSVLISAVSPINSGTNTTVTWTPANMANTDRACWLFKRDANGDVPLGANTTPGQEGMVDPSNGAHSMSVGPLTLNTDFYINCWNAFYNSQSGNWEVAETGWQVASVTISPVAVNGRCGGANGGTFVDYTALVAAGLCNPGGPNPASPSLVNNKWTWICDGQNGGSASGPCSATKSQPPIDPVNPGPAGSWTEVK